RIPRATYGRTSVTGNIGCLEVRMSVAEGQLEHVPKQWTHSHLLGLESLTADEINLILDTAQRLMERVGDGRHKLSVLAGTTTDNLFFENSTRTRTSIGLAARRLGA